jgi:nucleoside-diphosphate kinase
MVQILEGEDAIAKNRVLMGATDARRAEAGTIHGDFARGITANSVHGSDSAASARAEIAFVFATEEICERAR